MCYNKEKWNKEKTITLWLTVDYGQKMKLKY